MPLEFKRVEHHSNRARKNTTCIFATHKEITIKWKTMQNIVVFFYIFFENRILGREGNQNENGDFVVLYLWHMYSAYTHTVCKFFERINSVHSSIWYARSFYLCAFAAAPKKLTKVENNAWQKKKREGKIFQLLEHSMQMLEIGHFLCLLTACLLLPPRL